MINLSKSFSTLVLSIVVGGGGYGCGVDTVGDITLSDGVVTDGSSIIGLVVAITTSSFLNLWIGRPGLEIKSELGWVDVGELWFVGSGVGDGVRPFFSANFLIVLMPNLL